MEDSKKGSPTNLPAKQSWSLPMVAPLEPGIVCIDIDRMFAFYTGVLGLHFATDAEALPEMSTRFGTGPYGFRIIRLQTPYGERIKLIQPRKTVLRQRENPDWVFERQGIAYITFVVSDVHEVVVRLKEHSVDLVSEGPVPIRQGITAIFARDPEGNFLEFVQYADLASYRPDLMK
ncbi:MAG TPA: VOC family protein [Candidatus Sulfotelmatobacter sp.]|nr:VOC family protein [Candidatus Sulfotelmatobacter sp.]